MRYSILIFSILILLPCYNYAQEKIAEHKSDYAELLTKLDEELDSLSIFLLLDSLLLSEMTMPSDLILRFGYNNNVVNAGRTYGINQQGLSGGITYYHKSGFYGDLSGYGSNAFDPKYNLTMASVGYLGMAKSRWTYSANYERYLYNINQDNAVFSNLLTNTAGIAVGYLLPHFSFNLDYSLLFGSGTAHRIMGSAMGNWSTKNIWIFDRISFMPGASMMIGSEQVIVRFTEQIKEDIRLADALEGVTLTPTERYGLMRIRQRLLEGEITKLEADQRLVFLLRNNPDAISNLTEYVIESKKSTGIMNYSVNIPVRFTIKKFALTLDYIYSIPVSLPSETFEVSPVGFFSASVNYRFSFR